MNLEQEIKGLLFFKMEKEFEYTGIINNWMDLRDKFIAVLIKCDTELKFNKFLTAIILSIGVSPKGMQDIRKSLGVKEYSKEEMKKLKRMFEEDKPRKQKESER